MEEKITAGEYWYATEDGEIKHVKNGVEEIVQRDKDSPLVTIPLGYGLIAPALARVGDPSDGNNATKEAGIKKGDLVITYAALPKKQATGTEISEEGKKYASEHQLVRLVMTKEYAARLAKQLTDYVNEETEE